MNGGTNLLTGFNDVISTDNLDIAELPECLLIQKLSADTYGIATEEGATVYAFSSRHCQVEGDESMFCIYPTTQPRCAEFYGSLRDLQQADMYCEDMQSKPKCLEAVYGQFY